MINANYLRYNEFILLNTIINEKNEPGKSDLILKQATLAQAYTKYLNAFNTIEIMLLSHFDTQQLAKDTLGLCYSSRGINSTFKYVRGKIFSSQPKTLLAWCPYCLINEPETIDHYVGKTEFPEYAVLLKNLIPCCFSCNNIKDKKWRFAFKRRFIHFYNDTFIAHRFLHCDLVFTVGNYLPKIQYFLIKDPNITLDEFAIIQSHFSDLDLLNRYSKRAGVIFSTELANLQNSYRNKGVNIAVLINELAGQQHSKALEFGINYYESVLFGAMANSLEFIDLI